ncbi:MAG: hypothetical protein QOD32_1415 [Pyrinomonadaceae bacterium]|jgi:hypothetical protein|nr:hypothetical protein [Pyrinomonadaceae bacterium]
MDAKPNQQNVTTAENVSREEGTDASAHAAVATGAAAATKAGGALGDARLLVLGMWLGAAVLFSFAVAPGAFAVLPARELAGALVTRIIGVVNVGGFLVALLLLATAFARRRVATTTKTGRAWILEVSALALLALATGAGQWIIGARMAALRVTMGRPIDEVAASDPLRLAFNSLHGYSVAAMTTAMLAAVVAFILIARRNRG